MFTTNTGQTASQVPGLQRLQTLPQTVVSMSGSNNFILPTSISTTSHSGTSTTTTLPQFILQSQQHQNQTHLIQHKHQHSHSTQRIIGGSATLPMQLQQQLKQNIITVHTIGSNTAANTSPATASVLTPSSSPAPTTATLTLAPLIINSAQSQTRTGTADLLEDRDDVSQRYTNIVVSSSSSSGTSSVVRDVLTTPITMTLTSVSHSHHNAALNLKALDPSNV